METNERNKSNMRKLLGIIALQLDTLSLQNSKQGRGLPTTSFTSLALPGVFDHVCSTSDFFLPSALAHCSAVRRRRRRERTSRGTAKTLERQRDAWMLQLKANC